ncbi:MAG: hypothetical protein ACLP7F_18315 [Acidimicrobiales bacterium]
MLAGAAPDVDEGAGERPGIGEADEGRLRAADVPGGRRAGVRAVPIMRGVGCSHVPILSRRAVRALRERAEPLAAPPPLTGTYGGPLEHNFLRDPAGVAGVVLSVTLDHGRRTVAAYIGLAQ